MGKETEYVFDNDKNESGGFAKFIWNPRTKEFCGRDGASWGKVSLFYAIFYLILGSFFVGMIAVFVQIMPKDRPTYIGDESTLGLRGVNPGLGFRPQVDVEDSLIKYNPAVVDEPSYGYKKYVTNLNNFLNAKYPDDSENKFDHKTIFADTPCSSADQATSNYGYDTLTACYLIKLNKIYGWTPVLSNSTGVVIKCKGEFSADEDNVKNIIYHSEDNINQKNGGIISPKYFPYLNQKGYQAPFIWAQIDVNPNTLVNIDCKAYAGNIDNEDRMNRRGQTKFSIYVKSTNKAPKSA